MSVTTSEPSEHTYRAGRFSAAFASASAVSMIAVACAASAAESELAASSTQLEEVVVTSQRVAENLQDVPMSVTAVSTDQMQTFGMSGLSDIARLAPGLSVISESPMRSAIQIRGLSTTGVGIFQTQDRSLVAIYYDDTPIGLNSSNPPLNVFDLERVEVLKGPQGTLYGAGAMAGTIRYITVKPDPTEFSASAESTTSYTADGYSSKNAVVTDAAVPRMDGGDSGVSYTLRGMVNVPLLDDELAMRAVVYRQEEAGYIYNVFTGTWNDYSTWQGRLATRWTPTDALTVDASITYETLDSNGTNEAVNTNAANLTSPFSPIIGEISDYTQFSYVQTTDRDELILPSLTIAYDLGPVNVTSTTSYMDREFSSWSDYTIFHNRFEFGFNRDTGGPYAMHEVITPNFSNNQYRDFIQEIRVQSATDGPLKWTAGLFYERTRRGFQQHLPSDGFDEKWAALRGIPGYSSLWDEAFRPDSINDLSVEIDEDQKAVFGEVTYTFFDRLDVTAGLRYFDWQETYSEMQSGILACDPCTTSPTSRGRGLSLAGESAADGVNPRGVISYRINDDVMVYAEAAKGFRYGGVNTIVPENFCGPDLAALGYDEQPRSFGPDELWQYAVGQKGQFFDNRVRLNASAFLVDWTDVQTNIALPCSYFFINNSGKVQSKGVELDLSARVTPSVTLGLSGSYSDAQAKGGALDGWRAPNAPKYQATLTADYDIAVGSEDSIVLSGILNYSSQAWSAFTPPGFALTAGDTTIEYPSFTQLDLSATYRAVNWELGLYGNNLTGTHEYQSRGILSQEHMGIAPGNPVAYARPMTFGVRAKYRW